MKNTTIFLALCKQSGIPAPELEYPFAKEALGRKWRFDLAWPTHKVALEVDGAVWTGGRHTRGAGWSKDTDKLNSAAVLGWRMLRCTPQQLCKTEMIETIRAALNTRDEARG